jgi:hypothetical protein
VASRPTIPPFPATSDSVHSRPQNQEKYNKKTGLDALQGRREMMQGWADYLDELRSPKDIVSVVPKSDQTRVEQVTQSAGLSARILPFANTVRKRDF